MYLSPQNSDQIINNNNNLRDELHAIYGILYEVFMTVEIHIMISRVMTSSSLVSSYKRVG